MKKLVLGLVLAAGFAHADMLPQAIDCTGPGGLSVQGFADSNVLVVSRPGQRELRLSVILLDPDYPAYSVVAKRGPAVAGLVIDNVRNGAPNQSFLKLQFGADTQHPDSTEEYNLQCTIK